MAYDATKKRQPGEASMGQPTDPYASLLEPAQTPGTSAAPLQGGGGASPTGYVNFGDYFNANADAAASGAQQLQTSAGQKGQNAQAELGKAQSAFTGAVQSGTAQGPSTDDFWRASGYASPTAAKNAGMGVGKTPSGTQQGQATGKGPAPTPYSSGAPTGYVNMRDGGTAADNARWAQGAEKAVGGYTGPNALSDTSAYDQLLKDTTASSDEANAIAGGNNGIAGALQGSGNAQADAALLGAAGRQGFSDIGQRYGGGLNRLTAADAASQKQSDDAKQESANALKQYEMLAHREDATNAANRPDPTTMDAAPGVNGTDATLGGASTDPSTWGTSQWVREIGGYLSPIDDLFHLLGQKSPMDYGTDYFEGQTGGIGGQKSSQDQTLNVGDNKNLY